MEKNTSNKNISPLRYPLLSFLVILIISSCNPTRYVPQGETLLDENHVIINKEGIKKADLELYIKQKPNKRIFGTKFHLGLYNLSNIKKEKWPHSWLREIGEEPVIFDQYSTAKSREQIQSYIGSKGYFDSNVMETIEISNRKSKVFYNVDLKTPYTIRNLYYEIADTTIRKLFYFDSVNCMIERGKPYDVDVLQAERSRFERFVKDNGFYGFSGDHILFSVDSTIGNHKIDIYYRVKMLPKMDQNNRISLVPHSIHRVRNVIIYPDFVPKDALEGGENYRKSLDTTEYKGYYFISSKDKPEIKSDLILQSLYLKPGSIFNVTNTERTQSHLLSLKTYRLVNIFYTEVPEPDKKPGDVLTLDCNIQLTLLNQQSFKAEIEGTNSSGNLGGALNLIYQNKNLFHGAELFNLKLKGAYEATNQGDSLRSIQEYGIETSLRFPKFLLPFLEKESFIKKYNPTTTLLAAYNYQNMAFYTRTMANATFGYTWNGNTFNTHIINPIQLNLINMLSIDSAFEAKIATSYQAISYRDVMIMGGNYSFIYSNQKIKKSRDYWFVRFNAEAAGNIPGLLSKLGGAVKKEDSYYILGQPFAQYFRADIDLRYNVILNDVSSIVYRGFIGAGIPYGNSVAIPVEKQYFGGGANGLRAWQVRTLGPGSYNPGDDKLLNQTADIKIEANAEYRFKLFWILNGALFIDAGNIWSYNYDPATKGSQFSLTKFYDDIAVGTGTGIRLDLSFVMLRADMGMKLRDPHLDNGSKWIIMNRNYNFKDDFTVVFAIGYPF
ncbi:MAG: BamA/TamA family outer membrane protein [Bacteroidales bacterium]|nr:BamA/TamA family outer membrane protein [Bacteroidales bacterium]